LKILKPEKENRQMSTHTIDRLNAVAAAPTFIAAKDFTKPAILVETLGRLGLPVPSSLSKLAAAGAPLGTSGFKVSVYDVDCALKQSTLKSHERIALKIAIDRAGLFEDKR
jgi:hypothetical protein